MPRSHIFFTSLFLIGLLGFRIFYGLNLDFWNDDERHVYLLGLELLSFERWPYWGADIVHNGTQIPGALQGLLVGLPFFVAKIPEAPFVLLNLLSFAAILLFASYLKKHYSKYSLLTLVAWISSLPWTLEISTHVYNPSYLLLPSVIFFLSFFESVPLFRQGWIRGWLAFFLMGLAIGTIAQLHLSWPLLLPFVLLSGWFLRKDWQATLKQGLLFLLGLALPSLLIIPTIVTYGTQSVFQIGEQSGWNLSNLTFVFHNLVRLLCYASYESYLFLGETFQEKKEFITAGVYLLPFVAGASILTVGQVSYFFYSYLRHWGRQASKVRLTFFLFLFSWVAASLTFVVSSRPPVSRNLYLLVPLMLWCMFYSIDHFVGDSRGRRLFFQVVVGLSVIFHGLVTANRYFHFPTHSLYANRELLSSCLEQRDPYRFEIPRYREKKGQTPIF
ncbi:MAG: hypothetical protein HYW48_10740 [Deltaproteobacteria bacterium]|nr:hypothetical protein [Deltaproteobacteria bacterium]